MRALVAVFIDRFNGDGLHGEPRPSAGDQHPHFIFIAVALDLLHKGQLLPAEGPQTRLRVRQPLTVQRLKHAAGNAVAMAGARRHMGQGKITASQIQLLFPACQGLRQPPNVLHRMLTICVRRDYAKAVRELLFDQRITGLQRRALAAVDLMMGNGHAGHIR